LSTLGKILTVLVALVSVAVAVLVAREFVLAKNWKVLYDDEVVVTKRAMDDLANAISVREADKKAYDEDRGLLTERINTLTTADSAKAATIVQKDKDMAALNVKLQELSTSLAGFSDDNKQQRKLNDQYRQESKDAKLQADQFQTMATQLQASLQLSRNNEANLSTSLRQTQEEKAALEGKVAWLVEQSKIKLPEKPIYKEAPPHVAGLVTRANVEQRTAEIDIGSDSGVVKGMQFIVYGEPDKYLAVLTITDVGPKSAAGTLSIIKGPVKAKDHVTNKLSE